MNIAHLPLLLVLALAVCSCHRAATDSNAPPAIPGSPAPTPPTATAANGGLVLNIPDRPWAPESPEDGWCGETAIQEAALFHGGYFPQAVINRAGRPEHPDLWGDDLPVALEHLGLAFAPWPEDGGDMKALLNWTRAHLRRGTPVLLGVKIYPTAHPTWMLDHFVLASGFDSTALILNSTEGRQDRYTPADLASNEEPGYSLKNPTGRYFALAITGPAGLRAPEVPVRVFVERESAAGLDVVVKCESLAPGTRYVVSKTASYTAFTPWTTFTATTATHAFRDRIAPDSPAVYRCRPAGSFPTTKPER